MFSKNENGEGQEKKARRHKIKHTNEMCRRFGACVRGYMLSDVFNIEMVTGKITGGLMVHNA